MITTRRSLLCFLTVAFATILMGHTPLHAQPLQQSYVYKTWLPIYRNWSPTHRDWEDNTTQSSNKSLAKEMFLLAARKTQRMDVAIIKWWHPKDQDWVTLPAKGKGSISPAKLKSWGYKNPMLLGYGSQRTFPGSVEVYRWWHPKDRDWVTIPSKGQGHIPEATLRSWGYTHKMFICHAHQNSSK